jgi:hypothetical protein
VLEVAVVVSTAENSMQRKLLNLFLVVEVDVLLLVVAQHGRHASMLPLLVNVALYLF